MVHKCPKCNSINLRRGGIGIERIARFLEEQFPSTHLDILSSDTISHSHEANNKISEFVNKKEGILLTTNMIFKFLPALSSVAFGLVIPSVDAMTGLPDYSTLEKAIHKLYAFQLSAQSICVQSFQDWNSETHTTSPFIHRFVSESPLTLLNEELLQRDTYTYPPFVEIIALRNTNKFRSKALKLAQDTKKVLRSMGIKARGPIESYHSRGQGQFIFTLIIQCSPLEAETLKATITPVLSPFQSIEINPSQLFS
jgi:primosomal protein N'